MRSSPRTRALKAAVIYLVFGGLWIVFSDALLVSLVSDPERLTRFQTYKGWGYVALTAVLAWLLVTRLLRGREALGESEQRFHRALENIPDVVVIYGPDLRIQYINAATRRITGRSAAEYIGKRDDEVWPPDICGHWMPALKATLETGTPHSLEAELPLPGETPRTLHISCIPLTDEVGRVREILGITHDLTEARRAEQAIRQLNTELEQRVMERTAELKAANLELETFTYSVSHDLKAPLRGIDGYSRLLLQDHSDRLNEEGRLFANNIRKGAAQMGALIDDLLTYSRIERRALQSSPADLGGLVRTVVDERARDIEALGARVTLDLPSLTARADPEGLTQALRNLLDNALKFRKPNTAPVVEIGGRAEGDRVRLWVRDDGIGFDPRFHERVFEIFQRLQRAEDFPGTGIGLAIVRKAVQRMGGRVWTESAPGRGATFYLELPR